MDSASIGQRLGTMLNSHDAFSPAEKGQATGEIVNYIRELEAENIALLKRGDKWKEKWKALKNLYKRRALYDEQNTSTKHPA